MEEVPDEIPDLEPAQEYEELEETIPEPPPLKRTRNNQLKEKVAGAPRMLPVSETVALRHCRH